MLESRNGVLHFEGQNLQELAEKFETPFFLYSEKAIVDRVKRLQDSFASVGLDCDLHYSVKANPLLGILKIVHQSGGGFDVVSLGEAMRCREIGAKPDQIVFSGSGKSRAEIEFAIQQQIKMINVESESELLEIIEVAASLKLRAPVSLRINPNVDALTHEYITTGTHDTKFGVSLNRALHLYYKYQKEPVLDWVGLDMHIGSQLTERAPIIKALGIFAAVVQELSQKGFQLRYLDIGGGLGINYSSENIILETEFAQLVRDAFAGLTIPKFRVLIEPGRFVVGEAGILLTKVLHRKTQSQKAFLILDSGMGELIRPALYQAHHKIELVSPHQPAEQETYTVVGPICESTDQFAEDRLMNKASKGDLVVIHHCGAYGVSMESSYNSRPRTTQLLLESNGSIRLIRERESLADLWRLERY